MAKLPDFITAENELDGQEHVYIAQGGKTRKTLLQKIKEFVIGTATMGTTANDITGAIAEHTSQLNEIAKPSLLINGGFLINQRKQTQYNKNYKYTVDRWFLSNMNKDGKIEQGVLNVCDGYIELTGMGDQQLYINQTLNEDVNQLQNETVTFSVYARVENMSQGNIFIQITNKGTKDAIAKSFFDNTQLTSQWKRISITTTMQNSKITQIWVACGSFNDPDNGYLSVNTECKIHFRNAKLEISNKATPFVPRSYGEELALCQRYYTVLNYAMNTGGKIASQYVNELNKVLFDVDLPTPMRILPTMTAVNTDSSGMRFVNSINLIQTMENTIEMLSSNPSNDVNNLLLSMRLSIPTTTATTGWVDCFAIKLDSEIY